MKQIKTRNKHYIKRVISIFIFMIMNPKIISKCNRFSTQLKYCKT